MPSSIGPDHLFGRWGPFSFNSERPLQEMQAERYAQQEEKQRRQRKVAGLIDFLIVPHVTYLETMEAMASEARAQITLAELRSIWRVMDGDRVQRTYDAINDVLDDIITEHRDWKTPDHPSAEPSRSRVRKHRAQLQAEVADSSADLSDPLDSQHNTRKRKVNTQTSKAAESLSRKTKHRPELPPAVPSQPSEPPIRAKPAKRASIPREKVVTGGVTKKIHKGKISIEAQQRQSVEMTKAVLGQRKSRRNKGKDCDFVEIGRTGKPQRIARPT